jgi:predicted acetyltransferase
MADTWTPRLIDPSELRRAFDLGSTVFAEGPRASDDRWAEQRAIAEADRTFAVEDGGRMVGTGSAYSFEVALPGGRLPMSGVTWVGVLPTHRRRGILTALMDAVLDQAVERGEPLAGLTASEATIYRRFGFGVGARYQAVTIHARRSAELVELRAPGQVRLIDEDEGAALLPRVWERHWPRTPGELRRTEGWWRALAVDPEGDRGGFTARHLVVHEAPDGTPDGFAVYRLKDESTAYAEFYAQLQVDSLAAADERVEASLLRFLLDIDLVDTVRWPTAPVDLPLRWRLADSRALEVQAERDFLWIRPLDVAACLSGRTYATTWGTVLEVVDLSRPDVGGRFRLDADPHGAECRRTTGEPDVVLAMPELGAVLLGGVSWTTLHRAGLIEERTPGTIDALDAVFRTPRAPHCATDF